MILYCILSSVFSTSIVKLDVGSKIKNMSQLDNQSYIKQRVALKNNMSVVLQHIEVYLFLAAALSHLLTLFTFYSSRDRFSKRHGPNHPSRGAGKAV